MTSQRADDLFAIDLYRKLCGDGSENVFFSPISIELALAMTYIGAHGNTAAQMRDVLHFVKQPAEIANVYGKLLTTINDAPMAGDAVDEQYQQIEQPAYELKAANALWAQSGYGFRAEFTENVTRNFDAGLNTIDFATTPEVARRTINDWVARQTDDTVRDLIPSGLITELTRLVLTNAIYFKSNWDTKFPKHATRVGTFRSSGQASVNVPLMKITDHFEYAETEDIQLLALPYIDGALSMTVVLPRRAGAMDHAQRWLTPDNLQWWEREKSAKLVEVTLPKFKFDYAIELGPLLEEMGMSDAFSPEKADFSGMTSEEEFCISAVVHQAFVAVDEDGTEAAAATAVVMRAGSAPQEKPKIVIFNADHPFIFLIRHRATGRILFMGKLVNPEAKDCS